MKSARLPIFLLLLLFVVSSAPGYAQSAALDINALDHAQLTELGLSPAVVDRVLCFRTRIGPFREEKDLRAIKGIGRKTLEKLRSKIRYSDEVTGPRVETSLNLTEVLRADQLMNYRPNTKVNINTAGPDELISLPGIREAQARRIILDRTENGAFTSPDDLMRVRGIGRKNFARLERYLEVGDGKTIKRLDEFSLFSGAGLPETPTGAVALQASLPGDGKLHVRMLDVGQGDALLIITPGGMTVLVDAGEKSAARDVILPALEQLGIKRLNHFLLTHAHLDHLGGAETVLRAVDVDQVWDSGYPAATQTYKRFLQQVKKKKIPYGLGRQGVELSTETGLSLRLLHPDPRILAYGTHSDENMNSTVFRLEFGKFSMLFTGDIEADSEERLLKLHREAIRCTVLKAPHHGGEFSSTPPFLQAVAPELVLISVGAGNSFNHPHPDTLARYEKLKARILRSDLSGTIHLECDGRTWQLHEEFPGGSRPAEDKVRKPGRKGQMTVEEFGEPVNVNTAEPALLATIPMVGARTAEKIFAERQARGPFRTVDELARVKGLGPKLIERIRPFVIVGSKTAAEPDSDDEAENPGDEGETDDDGDADK